MTSEHITVCICTYKRPELLAKLLSELQHQTTESLFTYSVVVVDNDDTLSAKNTVEIFRASSNIDIEYYSEPEQNIALARNRAVQNVKGNFAAFIDDDEFPVRNWLLDLYKSLHQFKADGVLGPVKPFFEKKPPVWVIKGKLCERESFETGTILKRSENTRTGNVLFVKSILNTAEGPFDPSLGRTGGEDTDFFKRMIKQDKVFVWSNEASVYETVPPARLKRAYCLKRALLRGVANSKNVSFISFDILKSATAFVLYTAALPILLLIGHHLFMRYLIKDCDHIGKLLGVCGIKVIKERSF